MARGSAGRRWDADPEEEEALAGETSSSAKTARYLGTPMGPQKESGASETPFVPASHSWQYRLPSQPHTPTGSQKSAQTFGRGSHRPVEALPHASERVKLQNVVEQSPFSLHLSLIHI